MADEKRIDEVTGIETTGHVWDDDLEELNKPLPKWWLYVMYATIIWSIGYWIAYPAWPLVSDHTRGVLGFSQRQTVSDQVAEAKKAQAKFRDAIANADLAEISKDANLLNFALAGGRAAFGDNCAGCHGSGAQGFTGYPNLNDDDWLWGGTLEDIYATIRHGIRTTDDETRDNPMPRYGVDELLTGKEINDAAEYVLSLSDRSSDAAAAERGKATFEEQCSACHGEDARGMPELGGPRLTDAIWLFGGSKDDIVESIRTGRGGVMPAWRGRLDDVTVKQLAVFVHSLGGGQ